MSNETQAAYLNIHQASEFLNVSEHWLYRQVALGTSAKNPVPCVRFGRLVRFIREELVAWSKKNRGN